LTRDPDRDLKRFMAQKILDEWETLISLLPANWERLAHDHKLLETKFGNAKITNASDLLRLILVHAAADLPLRQTVALVAEAGGPDISPMRLHKKMIRAADYLHELVSSMVRAPADLSPDRWAGYVVSLVDATVISRPGSVNGDARIHHRQRLSDLRYLQVRSTGIDEGETLCNFEFEPGELVIGDRGYSHARGVLHAIGQGADVLIRLNNASMPVLARGSKDPIDLITLARSLHSGGVLERRVLVQHKTKRLTREIEGRVCIKRLPESEARKARTRARKEHGSNISSQVLELAGYVILFTTAPADRLSASQCVELYRLRWQIELQFKRWKSLCGFDRMPNFRADTIASWLYAKILSAVLLERLASLHSEVFSPIDCDDEEHCDADGDAALEVDPVAVAAARLRAVADDALRAASARRAYH
jgi:Transposase DDE domain